MQNRSRPRLAELKSWLPLLCAAPLLAANAPAERAGTDVTISVAELRNTHGTVMACMTANVERFPRCQGDPNSYRAKVPAGRAGSVEFHGVRPGRYAIALLHDENSNGKADRALSMIPKEGFGFSRDAKVKMGPPSFEDAPISVGGAPVRQTIRMRYML